MSILKNSGGRQSTIARFDPIQNSWTKLGDLNVARDGHGVIQVDNEILVIGGSRDSDDDEPTESCKLDGESMSCTTREPQLASFYYYAEIMHLSFI